MERQKGAIRSDWTSYLNKKQNNKTSKSGKERIGMRIELFIRACTCFCTWRSWKRNHLMIWGSMPFSHTSRYFFKSWSKNSNTRVSWCTHRDGRKKTMQWDSLNHRLKRRIRICSESIAHNVRTKCIFISLDSVDVKSKQLCKERWNRGTEIKFEIYRNVAKSIRNGIDGRVRSTLRSVWTTS